MAKEKINLREELNLYKFDFDLLQKIPCSKEENKAYNQLLKEEKPLPEGVFRYNYVDAGGDSFYTVYEAELSPEEIAEYLTYKKLGYLKTIKNCVVFFTVIAILSMLATFFFALAVI